jgi:outer membrane protein OmpA-like peptidoglycan-associated protein
MWTSRHPKAKLLGLWLVTTVLLPALGLAGTAETLSQPPSKELVSPPMGLQVSRPMDVQVSPPMALQFQVMDLQFPIEDVKGAVQALAMKETKTEVRIELSGDVLFEFDKADIRPEAEPALQRVVEIIQQYPRARVAIDGYTDAKGADAYNLRLSDKRAAAVKNWLVQKGSVNGKQIKAKGWGTAKPVAPNSNPDGSDNPDGRQKNRRVEITVKK